MFRWLAGVTPGFDWRGRMRFLRGRVADEALCGADGVSRLTRQRALALLCDAFLVPESQKYCLRADDDLGDIYRSITPLDGPDTLEFTVLHDGLEEALGRSLAQEELASVRTVGDVMRLLEHYASNPALQPPPQSRRG